jgi:hypothetical protein
MCGGRVLPTEVRHCLGAAHQGEEQEARIGVVGQRLVLSTSLDTTVLQGSYPTQSDAVAWAIEAAQQVQDGHGT